MGSISPQAASLYLLADHLDAALAMGEDLLTEKLALIDAVETPTRGRLLRHDRALNEFLSTVLCLELAMTARLLEARRRADELKRHDNRLRPLIALLIAGTAPLVDAAAELGDTSGRDFDTGDTASAFLRSRNLIAPDAAGFEGLGELAVSEEYLIAGRIRLGSLLDLIAAFLDGLDSLFAPPEERVQRTHFAQPARTPSGPQRAR